MGYDVRRKDAEFNYLHEFFTRAYPHILIPSISIQKKGKFEKRYYDKRTKQLNKFLNWCLRSTTLRTCPNFTEFLSVKDEKAYSKDMKNLEKFKAP